MPVKQEDLERAVQVKAIIEKEYHKPFIVADLAQMVGTNKSTLNLAFKALTGQSVKKYIRNFKKLKKQDSCWKLHAWLLKLCLPRRLAPDKL